MPYCKILIIDEDEGLRCFLEECFATNGMMCLCLNELSEVAYSAIMECHAAVISSMYLKGKQKAILSHMRSLNDIPVIVTMSAGSDESRVAMLSIGADDVIAKPFDAAELILKLKAMLRRTGAIAAPVDKPLYAEYSGLSVSMTSYRAIMDGNIIPLSSRELELLYMLLSNRNRICERAEIYSRVWGKILPDNKTLNLYINRLKKKIGSYADNIVSKRGVGYGFFTDYDKR